MASRWGSGQQERAKSSMNFTLASHLGSLRSGKSRTSLSFTVFVGPARSASLRSTGLAYHIERTPPPEWEPAHSARPRRSERRSGLILAREWQQALADGKYSSRAELARAVGVSRARVTQVLRRLADPSS